MSCKCTKEKTKGKKPEKEAIEQPVLSFIEPYMAENTFHEYRTDYPGNFFP
jgi:hypothetical protein